MRLLERTTRQMRLTEAGQRYYAQVAEPVNTLRLAAAAAESAQDTPRGVLRVTAPVEFGEALGSLLADFTRRCPDVHVQVELTGRYVDLIREGFDVALRVGELTDSSLVARLLGRVELRAFASPAYLERRGVPAEPAELPEHDCVLFRAPSGTDRWELVRGDSSVSVEVSGAVGGDDFGFVRTATVHGAGVGLIPSLAAEHEVAAGRLTPVLPGWHSHRTKLHLVYPSARFLPAKVRAFRDFLLEQLPTADPMP